jgi:hypothetical protein
MRRFSGKITGILTDCLANQSDQYGPLLTQTLGSSIQRKNPVAGESLDEI